MFFGGVKIVVGKENILLIKQGEWISCWFVVYVCEWLTNYSDNLDACQQQSWLPIKLGPISDIDPNVSHYPVFSI